MDAPIAGCRVHLLQELPHGSLLLGLPSDTRETPLDGCFHFPLLGWGAILSHSGQGISGMSFVGNWIFALPRESELGFAQLFALLCTHVFGHGGVLPIRPAGSNLGARNVWFNAHEPLRLSPKVFSAPEDLRTPAIPRVCIQMHWTPPRRLGAWFCMQRASVWPGPPLTMSHFGRRLPRPMDEQSRSFPYFSASWSMPGGSLVSSASTRRVNCPSNSVMDTNWSAKM